MTMDMDSGGEDEEEHSDVESSNPVEAAAGGVGSGGGRGGGGGGGGVASSSVPGEGRVVGGDYRGGARRAECSQQAVAASGVGSSLSTTRDRNKEAGRKGRESPPPLPLPRSPAAGAASTGSPSSTTTTSTATVTVPLSAPSAGALEALARELRTRPGVAIHAHALGGDVRDVDLVVGAQCAVCVRSRRQLLSQTHSSLSSPSRPKNVAGAGGKNVAASVPVPPLVKLLKEGLQRYARIVVVIVEGLEGSVRGGGGGGRGGGRGAVADDEQREAVGTVEALRGATVVSTLGWKEAADKVVSLVAQEASAGVGLPNEVCGEWGGGF